MGEPRSSSSSHTSTSQNSSITSTSQNSSTSSISKNSSTLPSPPPLPQNISLVQPSHKRRHKTKVVRVFRSVFRSLPIITPVCKFPSLPNGTSDSQYHINIGGSTGTKISGTLFGHRKGRVSFSIQENPRCLPSLVIELSMQTCMLQKEMAAGMVRVALECEKRQDKDKTLLIEEPVWTMYCNGKKTGYGVKREATVEDLRVMEILKAVTMGAGVVPMNNEADNVDGELAYMRASFEHVVGSKDSETLYMLSPDGNNNGPELTIFFVRI